jgi:hypothetical protein
MKKRIHTKINEYLNSHDDVDMIVEMARINGNELPYLVYVYGGNSYGKGRNEHGEPHFHFMDKMNGGKFKLSILIPSKLNWSSSKDLIILPDDSTQIDWSGLKKEKRMLIEWMDLKNTDEPDLTNYQAIRFSWNSSNKDNKNVRQIID